MDEEDEDFDDFEIAGILSRNLTSVKRGYKSIKKSIKDDKNKKKEFFEETSSEKNESQTSNRDFLFLSKVRCNTISGSDKDIDNDFDRLE